jgi:hypothetical protein
MQKWEYAWITEVDPRTWGLIFYKVSDTVKIRITQDKARGDKSVDDALLRTVAQLGLDGWELVGTSGENAKMMFFKRPLP